MVLTQSKGLYVSLGALQDSSADQWSAGLGSPRFWVWVEEGGHRAFSMSSVSKHEEVTPVIGADV